ncbi:unnamed protein product [Brachionus calyciflorus]|uniref:CAP-Gly domain-containing protein n=1 Tax=Brachionus calyciflorus TaxID=104777 RepID=A0A814M5F1_9BILA|nr:unnamed protein product [Brachionus calyciflorus]
MVNYDAITIGLEIEFIDNDKIHNGIVRYKGGINGKDGVWIGIEAKEPIGYCNGILLGRVYFKCREKFGLFLTADEIRLASHLKKKKKNVVYKSINSECDELLFKSVAPQTKIICITEDYLKRAKSSFGLSYNDIFSNQEKHTLKNNFISVPKKAPIQNTSKTGTSFQYQSSINRAYMPKDEMKLYTKLNWSYRNISLPRNTDLNNTFESFNINRFNYLGTGS